MEQARNGLVPGALSLKDVARLDTLILISRPDTKRYMVSSCINTSQQTVVSADSGLGFHQHQAWPEIIYHSLLGQYTLDRLLEGTTTKRFVQKSIGFGGLSTRQRRLVRIGGHINSPHV
jgi:hypothetical protein